MKSSVARHLRILEFVSLGGASVRFSELRRALPGIGDSTLARMLRSLAESGHLEIRADGGYALGLETRKWLDAMGSAPLGFQNLAASRVEAMTRAVGESAAVALLEGGEIRIVKSRTAPEAVSVVAEGDLLHFEPDHAAALAILDRVSPAERARLLGSRQSFIAGPREYAKAARQMRRSDRLWFDRSVRRPGICRLAVAFQHGDKPGAVFFCLTVEAAEKRLEVFEKILLETAIALDSGT